MLNSGDPVDISVWKSDGSILELRNVVSLRYSFYAVGATSSCSPPASAAKSATAASSASMTAKYFSDNILYLRENA